MGIAGCGVCRVQGLQGAGFAGCGVCTHMMWMVTAMNPPLRLYLTLAGLRVPGVDWLLRQMASKLFQQ